MTPDQITNSLIAEAANEFGQISHFEIEDAVQDEFPQWNWTSLLYATNLVEQKLRDAGYQITYSNLQL